jgi:hypothetical protein
MNNFRRSLSRLGAAFRIGMLDSATSITFNADGRIFVVSDDEPCELIFTNHGPAFVWAGAQEARGTK